MKKLYFIILLSLPFWAIGQGDIGYHVTSNTNLFKTINSGANWSNTFTSTVQLVDFVNENTGYHVTTNGNLLKTTNSGANWSNTFTCCVAAISFIDEASISVAVNNNGVEKELLLYPNPTTGNFTVDLGKPYHTTIITITDLTGRVVQSNTFSQLQLLNLHIAKPTGVYFLTITTGDKTTVIRLVKE